MIAPGKVFLCARNMVDTAAISSDQSYVDTMPPSNLQLSSRGRLWKTANTNVNSLMLEWSAALSERLNFCYLGRHNLEAAADWQVQGYVTYNWTGSPQIVDTGLVAAYDAATLGDLDFGVSPLNQSIFSAAAGQRYSLAYFLENSTAVNSMKMTLSDTGNSAGYLTASRWYVGRGLDLTLGAASATFGWEENTQQTRGDGGSVRSDGSLTWRGMELEVLLDADQRAEFSDMVRNAGMRDDWFVAVFPGDEDGELERDYTFLGRLSAMPKFVSTPDDIEAGIYRLKLNFVEI